MRIIAGKYRGRKLKSPPSLQTRPTSDRLRETLFNILAPRIESARFLDLCAGTGAVGIEALSRGAAQVTFVDQSRKMCALIDKNLNILEIDRLLFEVVCGEANDFLRRRAKRQTPAFDIMFFDPPYATDCEGILSYVGQHRSQLLDNVGSLIIEHHRKANLPDDVAGLERFRLLNQGDSSLSFYQCRES